MWTKMSNVFDDIIAESEGKATSGMKDVGLGEPQGCDPLARRNIIALDKRIQIEACKLDKMVTKTKGLEQVMMEMQVKLSEMEMQMSIMRGDIGGVNSSEPQVPVQELPAHLR